MTASRLCGFPPFRSDNVKKLYRDIRRGDYDFPDPYWTNVTDSAKDLIKGLMCVDRDKRLTAAQVLEHPWICGVSHLWQCAAGLRL